MLQPKSTTPSPSSPLKRHHSLKRMRSASPLKRKYSPTQTFSIPIRDSGYCILYKTTWTIDDCVSQFLKTYKLGPELRSNVRRVVIDEVIPLVQRSIKGQRSEKENEGKLMIFYASSRFWKGEEFQDDKPKNAFDT
ncbi:hypothetical protein P7C70_g7924, partial [Phenoliferia sp. Uapishka_3]